MLSSVMYHNLCQHNARSQFNPCLQAQEERVNGLMMDDRTLLCGPENNRKNTHTEAVDDVPSVCAFLSK